MASSQELSPAPFSTLDEGNLYRLELWVRGLPLFFSPNTLRLFEKPEVEIPVKNFIDELKIVRLALSHIREIISEILGENRRDITSFLRYIEESYYDTAAGREKPTGSRGTLDAELLRFLDFISDLEVVLADISQLGRISYTSFNALGRLLDREINDLRFLDLARERLLKSDYYRIRNAKILRIIRGTEEPQRRRELAQIFLELHKLLSCLRVIGDEVVERKRGKEYVVTFLLVHRDAEQLKKFLHDLSLQAFVREDELTELFDGLSFSLGMELNKVYKSELSDIVSLWESDEIYTRLEDSTGILRDCLQQCVISLGRHFLPDLKGEDIFADYRDRLLQSLSLRDGLWDLLKLADQGEKQLTRMVIISLLKKLQEFERQSLRALMYKDWRNFQLFHQEIVGCRSKEEFKMILHKFSAFLAILIKEVSKRKVLTDYPFTPE